jgi:hypothetical protein
VPVNIAVPAVPSSATPLPCAVLTVLITLVGDRVEPARDVLELAQRLLPCR